jgi:hypothetical protein
MLVVASTNLLGRSASMASQARINDNECGSDAMIDDLIACMVTPAEGSRSC